jgi:ribokinase
MWFKKSSVPRVICIGSCSQDIFFPSDEYTVFETPEDITSKSKAAFEIGGKFRVPDRYEAIGGVAANVSIGLSRLGIKAGCYTHIGQDALGDWAIKELEKESVVTTYVDREAGIKTDLSAIVVLMKSGDRIIFHNRDANERLSVISERLAGAEWIFMSSLNGEWKQNTQAILSYLDASGAKFALNPGQHNLKEDPAFILSLVARATVLLLNKDEAIELLLHVPAIDTTRLDDEHYLLDTLLAQGAHAIGLTDGVRGAWAANEKERLFAPIHSLGPVIDSTGAGDAFASGFLASHIQDESLARSLATGMLNSGGVVAHYGAIEGLQTLSERNELIGAVETQVF